MISANYNLRYLILVSYSAYVLAVEYDISKDKAVTCSATNIGLDPKKYATDGNLNTFFLVKYAYYGPEDLFNGVWIQIDLNGLFNISKIILWTTNDNDWYLSRDFSVHIKTRNNHNFDSAVELTNSTNTKGDNVDEIGRGSKITFSLTVPIFGRYVRIGKNTTESLYLAEVVVLTESTCAGIIFDKNISQKNKINNASYAIDGDINTCSTSVVITNVSELLNLDLQNNYTIVKIGLHKASFTYYIDYSIYVDEDESSVRNLCLNYRKNPLVYNYFELDCLAPLHGRYVKFTRDATVLHWGQLTICEIDIFTTHTAKQFNEVIKYTTAMPAAITSENNLTHPCSKINECGLKNSELEKDKIIIVVVLSIIIAHFFY